MRQQPDQVVDDGDHRPCAGAGVAGGFHRDLLVVARIIGGSLAVVHQRVVKAPVAGPGIQRDVLEPVALDHVHDDVRLPLAVRLLDLGRLDLFRLAHVSSSRFDAVIPAKTGIQGAVARSLRY